jgi:hypothetical protein
MDMGIPNTSPTKGDDPREGRWHTREERDRNQQHSNVDDKDPQFGQEDGDGDTDDRYRREGILQITDEEEWHDRAHRDPDDQNHENDASYPAP